LRAGVLAIVVSYLADTRMVLTKRESRQSVVKVLVDRSLSMTVPGLEYSRPEDRLRAARILFAEPALDALSPGQEAAVRRATRYDMARSIVKGDQMSLVRSLAATHTIETYAFADGVRSVEGGEGDWPPPEVRLTRIGDDVRRALQTEGGALLAGIVVLTDGQSNAGEDPLAVARFAGPESRRVPLYLVPLGSPDEPRDLEVRALYANPVALVGGDPVPVRTVVRSSGYAGETIEVILRAGDAEVSRREVVLRDDPAGQDLAFTYTPDAVGNIVLTVSIPEREGELLTDNNERSTTLRAVEEKIRVLYIEGPPRWDYRRLKNMFLRSAEVMDSSCLLLTADASWRQEGTLPITALPEDFDGLYASYDVIVFGDVDPNHPILSAQHLGDIARFVQEGGGLCVISGPFYTPSAYANTPLADLLPVRIADGRFDDAGAQESFRVAPTDRGIAHPILALLDGPEENRRMWGDLESLRWFYPSQGLKPLAAALAVHPFRKDHNQAPYPLVALHQHGRGSVLYLAIDETYRWGKGFPERSHLHPFNRFWGQAIRFLATEKMLGGRTNVVLSSDKSQYAVGEEAFFTARAIDPSVGARLPRALILTVRRPDQIDVAVPLERREGEEAVWQGILPVAQRGSYRSTLPPETAAPGETPAHIEFEAEAFTVELQSPRLNRDLLESMASLSDGRVVEWEDLGTIARLLEERVEVTPSRSTVSWMSMPLGWILLFVAVIVEWVGRKLLQLL
ncbi:MAG: hypothetical protein HY608_03745, partial [Planctomycetes bacterium]|nr:hypothetical protein [Planctomycetota bacterium]